MTNLYYNTKCCICQVILYFIVNLLVGIIQYDPTFIIIIKAQDYKSCASSMSASTASSLISPSSTEKI